MSKTGVIVSLVVAVVLAVVASVVLPPEERAQALRAILPFHPSQIVGINVRTTKGDEQTIERQIQGGWVYVVGDGERWPIERVAIDNALRLLVALSAEHKADRKGRDEWETWPWFSVMLEGGQAWRMWCEPKVMGGGRSVRVQPPDDEAFTARVEGDILGALIETGLGAWREKLALPGLSADTSRIRLESPTQTLQLVRRSGRWRLTSPVAVAADSAAVEMLLRYLAAVEVNRFVTGDVDRASLGLDNPISVAMIEREIVSGTQGNLVRKTQRRRLIVGGAADVAVTRFSAEITRTLTGPGGTVEESSSTIVQVSAKGLSRIVSSPTEYISKRAAEVAAESVGTITVRTLDGDVRFDRTVDGWFKRPGVQEDGESPDANEQNTPTRVLLDGEERLAFFLRQLCNTDAASVGIGNRFDTSELFEIELGSLTGQPLESITLSATNAGEIIATKGEVYWVIQGNLDQVIVWLLEQASGG